MNTQKNCQEDMVSLTKREKSVVQRRQALHKKYEEAVKLYAETDKPLKEIAEICNVSVGGLGSYLRRYWRELVFRHHGISVNNSSLQNVKIIETGKQNINAHMKYKDAVAACDSLTFIDLNISQIARIILVSKHISSNVIYISISNLLYFAAQFPCKIFRCINATFLL